MDIPEDKLAELKAKHADIYKLTSGDITIYVRRPTRGEYRRFRAEAGEKNTKADAVERLTRSMLVFPSQDEFAAILERMPAICEEFAEEILEIVGLTGQAQSEKL